MKEDNYGGNSIYVDKGCLEESMADLEESRRKLAVLQMKKHGTSVFNVPSVTSMVNGNALPDKVSGNDTNTSMDWKELEEAVDEAKVHSRILIQLYISLRLFYLCDCFHLERFLRNND